ncbi:hypothetical protein OL548_15660 [Lysinibacillus sp. MHQ-1]|nr:hypothetical protein OL548_15660 [Lysinibacillus sp. MHQ-1]
MPFSREFQEKLFTASNYIGYMLIIWPIFLSMIYIVRKKEGATMNRKLLLSITLALLLLLAGCSRKELKVPLEDIGMVGIMAFDYMDEDQMKLTVAIPQYSPEAQQKTQIFFGVYRSCIEWHRRNRKAFG